MLVRAEGKTILTDPGIFSTMQDSLTGIDIILISHEHRDHFHVESVKRILANNPNATIITNPSVGKLLEAEGIACELVPDGHVSSVHGISIEGIGTLHGEIYGQFGQVENTGYLVGGKLWYPGDSFTDPKRAVDILALPVAGPWLKLKEAFDYAIRLRPRVAFPVHDGILKNPSMMSKYAEMILKEHHVEFHQLNEGDEREF